MVVQLQRDGLEQLQVNILLFLSPVSPAPSALRWRRKSVCCIRTATRSRLRLCSSYLLFSLLDLSSPPLSSPLPPTIFFSHPFASPLLSSSLPISSHPIPSDPCPCLPLCPSEPKFILLRLTCSQVSFKPAIHSQHHDQHMQGPSEPSMVQNPDTSCFPGSRFSSRRSCKNVSRL